MTVRVLIGDVRDRLSELPTASVHCVVTSPPYWGLRDYGVEGQLGMERSAGEHIDAMVHVFREVWRVLRPDGTLWLNYGDCYATSPNGRSAADTKAAGNDDRTFRDKPFSTVGPIYEIQPESRQADRRGRSGNLGNGGGGTNGMALPAGRVVAGGYLKPKDLVGMPWRIAFALQADGWWLRSAMPWVKRNGMPESINDRPASAIEYVFLMTRSERYWYDADAVRQAASPATNARVAQDVAAQAGSSRANGGRKTNGPMKAVMRRPKLAKADSGVRANGSFEAGMSAQVLPDRNFRNSDLFFESLDPAFGLISDADGQPLALDVNPAGFAEAHFATFPPKLIEPLIRAGCPEGGVVLDPFGGAGTTGLVADRLRRDAILIELNPAYAAIAKQRIQRDASLFAKVVTA